MMPGNETVYGPQTDINFCNSSILKVGVKKKESKSGFSETYRKVMKKTRPRVKVIKGNPLWNRILKEHAIETEILMDYEESTLPHAIDTEEWIYLNKEILPTLLPAIEETLVLSRNLKVQEGKFRAFNYLDTLIHFMLNLNLDPSMPLKNVEDLKGVKKYLKKFPRPPFPNYKLWSRQKAATLIQKNVRGWLVRKAPEVHEMREFWREIRKEMSTRKGPEVKKSLVPDLGKLYLEGESSETDETIYNDGKQFFGKNEMAKEKKEEGFYFQGMKLPPISLGEKDLLKLASLSADLREVAVQKLWDENGALREYKKQAMHMREVSSQTEALYRTDIEREKTNPLPTNRIKSAGQSKSVSEYDSTMQSEQYTGNPEINKTDIEDS